MTVISVDLSNSPYDIHVRAGLLGDVGSVLAPYARDSRLLVVTDENVAQAVLPQVAGLRCRIAAYIYHPGSGHIQDFFYQLFMHACSWRIRYYYISFPVFSKKCIITNFNHIACKKGRMAYVIQGCIFFRIFYGIFHHFYPNYFFGPFTHKYANKSGLPKSVLSWHRYTLAQQQVCTVAT